ncbi:hypothetical protein [Streptomyces sp. NPDC059874]|uniref:hypothetical protein n=1 Tax=Streptomyces sp. NPDC059874 TaxID=3346983 RepID=UPI003668FD28
MNEFTAQYIATALADLSDSEEWTRADPPMIDDLSDDVRRLIMNDCRAFQFAASEYFKGREADAGHDFWLTRNGHGAGFWDGDWPEPVASILTVAAKVRGEFCLYYGDDGLIYGL